MHEALSLLPVVAILAAGLGAILAARFARVSAIVGFLIAGALLGEHGFRIIAESPTTELLAELGVVFLLFDIGLHFSLKEIRQSRRDFLMLAPAQVLLGAVPFAIIARWAGADWPVAIVIGGGLALSSTAVVVRLLADRNLATCPLGRSATAILVFQDVVAIFLLVVAQALGDGDADLGLAIAAAAGKAAVAFAAAAALGRFVARPAFRLLAATRNEEAFPAAVLLVVLATAAATGALGLSLTLGAFLAGMMIADTPYRHVIQTEVRPFRSLLMGFFFMSVGMHLDIAAMAMDAPAILFIAAGLIAIKAVLITAAARAVGWSRPGSIQLAGVLAQGSEFALVLLAVPAVAANLPGGAVGTLVAAIAVSLALTPLCADLALNLARRTAARARAATPSASEPRDAAAANPVVVFGMTPAGRLAIDALRSHGIRYLAIDNDPDRHLQATADGYDVLFGDAGDVRFMDLVNPRDPRSIVLGITRYEVSAALTPYIKERFGDLPRFVAVDSADDQARHAALGMRAFLKRDRPEGIELATALLRFLTIDEARAEDWARSAREKYDGAATSSDAA